VIFQQLLNLLVHLVSVFGAEDGRYHCTTVGYSRPESAPVSRHFFPLANAGVPEIVVVPEWTDFIAFSESHLQNKNSKTLKTP